MTSKPVKIIKEDNIEDVTNMKDFSNFESNKKSTISCPLKLECDSPTNSPRLSIITSNLDELTPPRLSPLRNDFVAPPPPLLRRERKTDYGVFESNFEVDVKNWFKHIDNNKRIELINILAKHIAYTPETILRPPTPPFFPEFEVDNDIKLDNVEQLDINEIK